MFWRDIPRLTRDGHYQVDISLDYLETQIGYYTKEHGLDLDVDFQRAHVWTDGQRTAFVEHLLRGGKGSNVIRFNHPHWMSIRNCRKNDRMVCIDGKQRLTACLRFWDNQFPVFGLYRNQYEGRVPVDVGLRFQVNNLKTRREELQWYLEINEGGTQHTKAEIDKVKHLLWKELTDENA